MTLKPGWTTTALGLGAEHQQARPVLLSALRSGVDRCPRCRLPMWRWQRLDVGDYPSRIICQLRGITPVKRLEHAACNRSAGATLGNHLRQAGIRRARTPTRRTPPVLRPYQGRW